MKINLVKPAALVALLFTFIAGACQNPINPRGPEISIPAGKGVVRVEAATGGAAGGGARTVIPSLAGFSRFEYWFAKDGGEAAEKTALEGVFEMEPGSYTVTVKAFVPEGAQAAAEGTSAAFEIAAGTDAGAVTVTLVPVVGEGEGTLVFALTYPEDAELSSLTLTRLGGSESFDLTAQGTVETGVAGKIFSGTKTGIGAGYWLARASLNKGEVYTGKSEVAHIYKDMSSTLGWVFDEADFVPIPVVSAADSGPGTLRAALQRTEAAGFGGTIFIDLPEGNRVITLTSPLPKITTNLTIAGNGATLTQSGFVPADGYHTQLLFINDPGAMVRISRLHFKGGRVSGQGGAIHTKGSLTLESCIFSDNQQLVDNVDYRGGAVYSTGAVTVLGCTFYNNGSSYGVISGHTGGTLYLGGNLFCGDAGVLVGGDIVGNTTSLGYNVTDHGLGPTTGGIGWNAAASDILMVTGLLISPATFKPMMDSPAATALTSLPEGYPARDFYGRLILAGGAAGAVQDQATGTGFFLDYGTTSSVHSTVSPDPAPDENGFYAANESVTLTATAAADATFSHWTVNGANQEVQTPPNKLTFAMDAHTTVRAVFTKRWTVNDTGDTAGSAAAVTLRYALNNAMDNDAIALPAGATISLKTALPEIAKSMVIEGNGATLTGSVQLLYVRGIANTVKISRLHFKGGLASTDGGAIWSTGTLTLESCIFSDNRQTATSGLVTGGGAVHIASTGVLTVLGCTFYNNRAWKGAAIYHSQGVANSVLLTGNLFAGNAASDSGNVASSRSGGRVTSMGYNVSDYAAGTDGAAGSGYGATTGDVFSVAALPLSPVSFKPVTGGAAANVLPNPLPEGYPAADFYGDPIAAGGAAGAVQTLAPAAGYSLDYGVNNNAYGTISPNPAPDANGFYAANQSVTLTAQPNGGAQFSHWTVNGVTDAASNTLNLAMDAHKIVRAVFRVDYAVTDPGDTAGSAAAATLRYALSNAIDGDTIALPAGATIGLKAALPEITKSIVIAGNGATLTRDPSYTEASDTSQLLYVTGGATVKVKISRLHFKGGRATNNGGAIRSTVNLTLESCVFSDNQITDFIAMTQNTAGGAIHTATGSLTVLGCTFYNNTTRYRGGAIYCNSGTVSLTGNLFFGNTASNSGPVVYGTATSYGYNVSDIYMGAAAVAGDLLTLTNLSFASPGDPTTKPMAPANLETLVTLPADFPATYFDGSHRETPAAAGAMASLSHGKFVLGYSVSNDAYGQVDPSPAPEPNGYSSGQSVTLTVTVTPGIPGVTFSHWIVNGVAQPLQTPPNQFTITMDDHQTVRAVFMRDYVVNDSGDTAGSAETITLRYALTNAGDGDTIALPAGATISLTEALPQIAKSIVITGNGATLTRAASMPANANSQLLYITGGTVKISRLYFKGGRATNNGAAVRNSGNLTLESCVFNDNQTTASGAQGGAIYTTTGSLTVLGCTFYNNKAGRWGGVIYRGAGTVSLTGNLFFGNTASQGNVAYNTPTSGGYNVSDKAAGTNSTNGSGYAAGSEDLFSVTDISFATDGDPATKPSSATSLKTLTALPDGFPATYFDGSARTLPATAGAVSSD
jgi:predicted outer membrane repeat protein